MKLLVLPLIALALTACSNSYDSYLGYWQQENTKNPRVMEITKEGKEVYVLDENIFAETDRLGKPKSGSVLEVKDKALAVNNGLTVSPFVLSDDKKSMRIGNNLYIKISDDAAKTMVTNYKQCKELRTQYIEQRKSYSVFASPEEKARQKSANDDFLKKQEAIPNCSFNIF